MKPILPAVLSLPLVVAACGGAPQPSPAGAAPVPVSTSRVEVRDLPAAFEAGGIVQARTTASIASRILAPVIAVHVRAGDRVARGARLVSLEGREVAAARARAQAASRGSDDGVSAAEGAVRAAEAALTLSQATYDRVRTLHEKRSATPHELDQATAGLDGARAQLASARANLAAAGASRIEAHAAVEAASAAEGYGTLAAPFDGVVTERAVDPGDMAVPGVRLLTIEDRSATRLEVILDEARAVMVATAQPVRVALGDGADAAWVDAVVGEIARVDPASHSVLVKLDLPANAHQPSGTFGRARFAGRVRQALVIPAAAAVPRGQLTFVYVVDDGGRVRLQPISPGARTGDLLEVLAGLDANARVVNRPSAALIEGTRIREDGQ